MQWLDIKQMIPCVIYPVFPSANVLKTTMAQYHNLDIDMDIVRIQNISTTTSHFPPPSNPVALTPLDR